ncbi:MAG TPA: ABC transporter permease [Candidatus Nanopelagicales bacterium]|nr:ABC transporter permease [Candidatus Nanopelagicales bacterium]
MSAPVEERPADDVPEIPAPPQLSARSIVRARRRAAFTTFTSAFRRERSGMLGLGILLFFVAIALLAPLLFPKTMLDVTQATGQPFQPPSLQFPLGTDDSGRSVLALVVWGARISLLVGFAATVLSMVIGTSVGIVSGHFRGFTGGTLDRVTDWFLVIPYLPLAIVLATILGRSLFVIIVVIGVTSWPGTARIIRSQTLSVSARPYLERSKALGAGNVHQMTRHVLPNVMPLVLANTTLAVSISILSETTLSFLGLGDPTAVSWGSILEQGFSSGAISQGAWWYLGSPGVCVVLVVLAFNLIGRAIESVLDPREASR